MNAITKLIDKVFENSSNTLSSEIYYQYVLQIFDEIEFETRGWHVNIINMNYNDYEIYINRFKRIIRFRNKNLVKEWTDIVRINKL